MAGPETLRTATCFASNPIFTAVHCIDVVKDGIQVSVATIAKQSPCDSIQEAGNKRVD
jgi:hypothetical protein